ncbi:MAG TPA: IS5 family transposase [Vicinamibacterales bacterium]|jgi:transposase|nr:IS5 family transposase [Vicinamibacterales bacterium]
MRGADEQSGSMFSYVSLEQRVPPDHPLRAIRRITDRALARLSPKFGTLYINFGRPSIAPEKLLRALLLQAIYTIRSERQLIEQLDYNLLFRWFVGLGIDDAVWSPTTFTKNRDRLLDGDIASAFFEAVLIHADTARLLSDDHFTVDGTLLEAWASQKSFRPRDQDPPPDGGGNPTVNFHGQRRRNATHQSTTDPDARLSKKAQGREARLGYLGHVLMEHRSGLIVNATVTPADGHGERDAAVGMIGRLRGQRRITVAADKAYDTRDFVANLRAMAVTPHVAQYTPSAHRSSAIDGRTTRHAGYAISQQKRKLVEQGFGWMKTVGGLRKLRHRGGPLVTWIFTFTAAAYNIVRLRRLLPVTA